MDNLIWILDPHSHDRKLYSALFSSLCTLEFYESHVQVEAQYYAKNRPRPALLICEMQVADGRIDELCIPSIHTFRDIPTIVVSALDDPAVITKALDSGALDYLLKPVSPHLLRVKVNRLLQSPLNGGRRPLNREIFDQIRNITSKERLILEYFLSMDENSATRKQIISHVWKGMTVSEKTLDVHFYHLRRKIREWGYDIVALPEGLFKLITKDPPSVAQGPAPSRALEGTILE